MSVCVFCVWFYLVLMDLWFVVGFPLVESLGFCILIDYDRDDGISGL